MRPRTRSTLRNFPAVSTVMIGFTFSNPPIAAAVLEILPPRSNCFKSSTVTHESKRSLFSSTHWLTSSNERPWAFCWAASATKKPSPKLAERVSIKVIATSLYSSFSKATAWTALWNEPLIPEEKPK